MRYPLDLGPDQNNTVIAQAIDVPEALTFGDDEAEACEYAIDAVICALGGYIDDGRPIPQPSPARSRPVATLPPMVAAKLAIYEAMRRQGLTRTALAALGKCLVLEVRDAA
jgi:antitoxin HicB